MSSEILDLKPVKLAGLQLVLGSSFTREVADKINAVVAHFNALPIANREAIYLAVVKSYTYTTATANLCRAADQAGLADNELLTGLVHVYFAREGVAPSPEEVGAKCSQVNLIDLD